MNGADSPQGDGWWQASDGKWYPPESRSMPAPPPPPPAATSFDDDPPTPKPPWWRRRWVLITAGTFIVLIVIAALTDSGSDEPADDARAVSANDETPDGAATATEEPAEPSTTTSTTSTTSTSTTTTTTTTTTTLPVISAGTYIVGTEIEPGIYRVVGYWARLDETLDIIDNENSGDNGIAVLVVQPSDTYIEVSNEAAKLEDFPVVDPIALGYTEGTYLVGIDIQPGRYRITAIGDRSAYSARLDNTLDTIANDRNDGSVLLIIQPTDFAVKYSGLIEALPEG